jgi:hypothetical protein
MKNAMHREEALRDFAAREYTIPEIKVTRVLDMRAFRPGQLTTENFLELLPDPLQGARVLLAPDTYRSIRQLQAPDGQYIWSLDLSESALGGLLFTCATVERMERDQPLNPEGLPVQVIAPEERA